MLQIGGIYSQNTVRSLNCPIILSNSLKEDLFIQEGLPWHPTASTEDSKTIPKTFHNTAVCYLLKEHKQLERLFAQSGTQRTTLKKLTKLTLRSTKEVDKQRGRNLCWKTWWTRNIRNKTARNTIERRMEKASVLKWNSIQKLTAFNSASDHLILIFLSVMYSLGSTYKLLLSFDWRLQPWVKTESIKIFWFL